MKKTGRFSSVVVSFLLVTLFFFVSVDVFDDVNAQERRSFERKLKVIYRFTDVVVRDDRGRFVKGLKPEDFRLTINGERIEIKSVDEFSSDSPATDELSRYVLMKKKSVEEGTPPPIPPTAPRTFVMLFDRFNSGLQGISESKKTAKEIIEEILRPWDQVAVYEFNSNLKQLLAPTDDRAKAFQAIDHVKVSMLNPNYRPDKAELFVPPVALPLPRDDSEAETPPTLEELAQEFKFITVNQIAAKVQSIDLQKRIHFRNFLRSLMDLSDGFASVPGRKSFLIFSEGPAIHQTHQRHSIQPSQNRSERYTSSDQHLIDANLTTAVDMMNNEQRFVSEFVENYSNVMNYLQGHVASNNSTFYTIRRGPIQPAWMIAADQDLSVAGDLYRMVRSDILATMQDILKTRVDALRVVSSITEGKHYDAGFDSDKLFKSLSDEVGNYYMLGFSLPKENEGSFYNVRIEVDNRRHDVAHRKGFIGTKPAIPPGEIQRFELLAQGGFEHGGKNELRASVNIYQLPFSNVAGAFYQFKLDHRRLKRNSSNNKELELILNIEDREENLHYWQHKLFTLPERSLNTREIWLTGFIPLAPLESSVFCILRDKNSGEVTSRIKTFVTDSEKTSDQSVTSPLFLIENSEGNISGFGSSVPDSVRARQPLTVTGVKIPSLINYENRFDQGKNSRMLLLIGDLPADFDSQDFNIFVEIDLNKGTDNEQRLTLKNENALFLFSLNAILYSAEVPVGWSETKEGTLDISVSGAGLDSSDLETVEYRISDFSARFLRKNKTNTEAINILDFSAADAAAYDEDYEKGLEHYEKGEYEEARIYLTKAAGRDLTTAMIALGNIYWMGQGVEKDVTAAVSYFRKAARRDNADACYFLARIHEKGTGIDADVNEAIKWYSQASDLGMSRADMALGRIYLTGDAGAQKSPRRAFEYYLKAAERGDDNAQFNVAKMYETGRIVAQDLEKAAYWYIKSAGKGNMKSKFFASIAYLKGMGIKQDISEALALINEAAEGGIGVACTTLAALYHAGEIVDKDMTKAVEWYQRGAELIDPAALCFLGELYLTGNGVEHDFKKAYSLFKEAADWGHPRAMFNLGVVYLYGQGVESDPDEAKRWFNRSANLNYDKAKEALVRLEKKK